MDWRKEELEQQERLVDEVASLANRILRNICNGAFAGDSLSEARALHTEALSFYNYLLPF